MAMEALSSGGFGRTRWRRVGILLLPGLALVAVMVVLIARGALAVNVAFSGIPFTLSADSLTGTSFVQYAEPDAVTNGAAASLLLPAGSTAAGSDSKTYVADTVTSISNASINNLDQVICAPLPIPLVGKSLKVEIKAGGSGTNATASSLVVNAPSMTADSATFNKIQIGADAGQAFGGGANGVFSQKADSVALNGLHQVAINTTADSFTLPGLSLGATFVSSC